jgi:hypothetical protein
MLSGSFDSGEPFWTSQIVAKMYSRNCRYTEEKAKSVVSHCFFQRLSLCLGVTPACPLMAREPGAYRRGTLRAAFEDRFRQDTPAPFVLLLIARHYALGVIPTEVVNAADGGFASDAGMGSVVIVVVEPGLVGGGTLGF